MLVWERALAVSDTNTLKTLRNLGFTLASVIPCHVAPLSLGEPGAFHNTPDARCIALPHQWRAHDMMHVVKTDKAARKPCIDVACYIGLLLNFHSFIMPRRSGGRQTEQTHHPFIADGSGDLSTHLMRQYNRQ